MPPFLPEEFNAQAPEALILRRVVRVLWLLFLFFVGNFLRLQGKSQIVQEELVKLGEQMVSSVEGTRALALELCREFEEKFLRHLTGGEVSSFGLLVVCCVLYLYSDNKRWLYENSKGKKLAAYKFVISSTLVFDMMSLMLNTISGNYGD